MNNYPTTTIGFVPRPSITRHSTRVVPIHNGDIYGNIPIQPTYYSDYQTPPTKKSWNPIRRKQEERPLSDISSEHVHLSSNDRSKNTSRKEKHNKHPYSTIFKICWATAITILTIAALSIAIYELIVTNIIMTTTTTTTTTTSTTTTTTTTTVANLLQCSSYSNINDGTRLATAPGGTADDIGYFSSAYRWYRFIGASGTRIVTSPPSYYQCGGYYSGWYTGTMPTYGHTIAGTVCYVTSNNVCNFVNTILVTNCGSYYVYALIDPPITYGRYCTE